MAELSIKPKQVDVKVEAEGQEWFDLLPVEKKLVGYTLGTGLVLLCIFVFIFRVLLR